MGYSMTLCVLSFVLVLLGAPIPSFSSTVQKSAHPGNHAALPLTSFLETEDYMHACLLGARGGSSLGYVQKHTTEAAGALNPLTSFVSVQESSAPQIHKFVEAQPSTVDVTRITKQFADKESDPDTAIDLTKQYETSNQLPHVPAASLSVDADGGVGSCCGSLRCGYTNGVCCSGMTHCCPPNSVCIGSDQCLPLDAAKSIPNVIATNNEGPLRVIKVEIKPREAKVDLNEQEEKAKKYFSQEQEEKTKRREQFHKNNLAPLMAQRDTLFDGVPPLPDDTAIPEDKKNKPKANQSLLKVPDIGAKWPPLELVAPDIATRNARWIPMGNTDWRGLGMIVNGTTNRQATVEDCRQQCETIIECRLFLFINETQECWLDSDVGLLSKPCPNRIKNGKEVVSSCTTFFKKMTDQEKASYRYGVVPNAEKEFITKRQENWHGFGGLVRSGLSNQATSEESCRGQCAARAYCVVAVYFPRARECWMGTSLSSQGAVCPLRQGVRECVSFIKRAKPSTPDALLHKFDSIMTRVDASADQQPFDDPLVRTAMAPPRREVTTRISNDLASISGSNTAVAALASSASSTLPTVPKSTSPTALLNPQMAQNSLAIRQLQLQLLSKQQAVSSLQAEYIQQQANKK